ncbi:cyanoexosortase B system-associated protein [Planktothrix mougeotii]|uniref:Cyanoexosortase B system-associated protein n=1 Tax=Planktothrix mougeotii LEGE 06226 TaxID=1828728 RepID=A0ABR9UJI1_9CYAN|nr:cyanoexosortase B system-associated protein [Planktothrix mougeotii]MBE9146620.1 cyanoexosortase B system-associated protein [Planktothrix mougeotii LEGE 06226]
MRLSKVLIVIVMTALLIGSALPGYVNQKWSWIDMPQLKSLPQLQTIRKEGLALSGWQTVKIESIQIGNQQWLKQEVKRDEQTAIVLLLTQNYYKDQPQVEWMDLTGFLGWKTDEEQRYRFSVKSNSEDLDPVEVEVKFFKAWTATQTYAVAQWYAWPNGGHPAPSRWFWVDRWAQLSQNRASWVAVCLLIPIKPLGNIQDVWPVATSLGESVQASFQSSVISHQSSVNTAVQTRHGASVHPALLTHS